MLIGWRSNLTEKNLMVVLISKVMLLVDERTDVLHKVKGWP